MHPAFVCDMELVRICISESKQMEKKNIALFSVLSMPTKVGLCCNPEGPELDKAKERK